jgi:hypothetical protein
MSSHWFHREMSDDEHEPTTYTCLKCERCVYFSIKIPRSCPGCGYACDGVACTDVR